MIAGGEEGAPAAELEELKLSEFAERIAARFDARNTNPPTPTRPLTSASISMHTGERLTGSSRERDDRRGLRA